MGVKITKSVAVFTILVGGMAVFGWFFDIMVLKTVLPSMIPMKFNTALCFFLLGIALYFHTNDKFKVIINIVFAFVSLMGFLTLVQYIYGIDLRIDGLFWNDVKNPIATSSPGRMSPNTAFGFLMIGTALLFVRNQKLQLYVVICLTLGLLGSFVGLFNFMFGYGLHDVIPSFSQIALITAITLSIICVGVFYSPYLESFKISFENKLTIGFVFTIIILSGLFYVYSENRNSSIKTRNLINHTRKVISQTELIFNGVMDVETGGRGYVITGNHRFLEPYSNSVLIIPDNFVKLKKIIEDDYPQQSKVGVLENLVERKIDFTKQIIEARAKGFEPAKELVVKGKGKILMDSIRLITKELQGTEIRRLEKQKKLNEIFEENSNRVIFFSNILIIMVLMSLFFLVLKNSKRRKQVEILLWKSNEKFSKIFNYSPVAMAITTIDDGEFIYANDMFCQSTRYEREKLIGKKSVDINMISWEEREKSIKQIEENGGQDKNTEIKITKADGKQIDILFSTETLEIDGKLSHLYAFVDISERKKAEEKLKEVNKELDSFTYSVSHDLRAPLRAISGYTKILNEDYGNLIDAEGRRVMNVISNNAKKMGQLIDDLLAFSRIGRQNIINVTINMDHLVKLIKDDLMDFSDSKNIQINIQNLINATGDNSMIKVVMTNLLSNAIKYSSKKDEIVIEVGSYYEGKNIVYYVKDNGAGFDMQYYDKLFGVFQRLHSISEFEGTGVGLAIVQRIIKKHGGKVWAESKIDVGSIFYFSLPKV